MPGKAFSGKQKKEQLKAKRQEKRGKADRLQRKGDGTAVGSGGGDGSDGSATSRSGSDVEAPPPTLITAALAHPAGRPASGPGRETGGGKGQPMQQQQQRGGGAAGGGGRPGTGGARDAADDDTSTVRSTTTTASSTMKLGADKRGVRSIFAKEGNATVEARKKLSYAPIATRDFRPGVAYGAWFELLSGAALDHGVTKYSPSFPFSISLPTRVAAEANVPEELLRAAHEAGRAADNPTEAEESVIFAQWLKRLDRIHQALPPALAGMEINLFERNLDTWRQLWRTVEISDIVAIVADARYPILHLPLSLLHYVKRVNGKPFVVLLNKVDLVPESHVSAWKAFLGQYFVATGIAATPNEIPILSFSCLPEAETVTATENQRTDKRRAKKKRNTKLYEELHQGHLHRVEDSGDDEDERSDEYAEGENFKGKSKAEAQLRHGKRSHKELAIVSGMIDIILTTCKQLAAAQPAKAPTTGEKVLGRKQQQERKKTGAKQKKGEEADIPDTEDTVAPTKAPPPAPAVADTVHIGLVGHPNVGKSSLINCIRGTKVVSVSASAGHTKHLQTIPIPADRVVLVDCPGLAFPVLGVPRQLQAVIGTHQIAQTRDPQSSVGYLATRLPLEKLYGLKKVDGIEADPWSSFELCESYATKKGFMVKHGRGVADVHRAAIELLQEAYEGRLVLYFSPPLQPEQFLAGQAFKADVAPMLMLRAFPAMAPAGPAVKA